MPQSMRLQLSLICADRTLYDGLLIPFKENKELHSLVLKLLSAYYYNGSVRDAVEGYDLSSYVDKDVVNNSDQNNVFAEVRKTLTAMNFLASTAKDELEGGIEEMLARINDVAKQSGGEASVKSDFGTSAPVIRYLPTITEPNSVVKLEPSDVDHKISEMENQLGSQALIIAKMSENLEKLLAMQTPMTVETKTEIMAQTVKITNQVVDEATSRPKQASNPIVSVVTETEQISTIMELPRISISKTIENEIDSVDEDNVAIEEARSGMNVLAESFDYSIEDESTDDSDTTEADSILNSFLANGIGFTERF